MRQPTRQIVPARDPARQRCGSLPCPGAQTSALANAPASLPIMRCHASSLRPALRAPHRRGTVCPPPSRQEPSARAKCRQALQSPPSLDTDVLGVVGVLAIVWRLARCGCAWPPATSAPTGAPPFPRNRAPFSEHRRQTSASRPCLEAGPLGPLGPLAPPSPTERVGSSPASWPAKRICPAAPLPETIPCCSQHRRRISGRLQASCYRASLQPCSLAAFPN